ncbi:MAG: ROK family protein [Dehalococcoidia bacterium]|nr:ROK family protein [Dehalococcoidia bacterium]
MTTHVLAADIGATSMRASLVEVDSGELLARAQVPTRPEAGFERATERLADLLEHIVEHTGLRPAAAGVSTAGPLDPTTGTYQYPPNLPGWHGQAMKPALVGRLGIPVEVGHDATLAALGETRYGARAGARDLVYVTVSTGIGAGIIAGGRAVTGSRGGAGEVGHVIVNPGGRACGAGCAGCLEGQSSGSALAAVGSERLGRELRAEEVFALAQEGDATARAVVLEAIEFLGAGLAGLLATLDPAAVILGGGVARGIGAAWWRELLTAVGRYALPRYEGEPPIELTVLGDDASLLGAALWATGAAEASRA